MVRQRGSDYSHFISSCSTWAIDSSTISRTRAGPSISRGCWVQAGRPAHVLYQHWRHPLHPFRFETHCPGDTALWWFTRPATARATFASHPRPHLWPGCLGPAAGGQDPLSPPCLPNQGRHLLSLLCTSSMLASFMTRLRASGRSEVCHGWIGRVQGAGFGGLAQPHAELRPRDPVMRPSMAREALTSLLGWPRGAIIVAEVGGELRRHLPASG